MNDQSKTKTGLIPAEQKIAFQFDFMQAFKRDGVMTCQRVVETITSNHPRSCCC